MEKEPRVNGKSPWGKIQHADHIADGIWNIVTARHGGLKISTERQRQMPPQLRIPGGWYEEDVDWARVVVAFGNSVFIDQRVEKAHQTLVDFLPDLYEDVFHVAVKPEDSRKRREDIDKVRFKHHWIGISASGDWKPGVPKGYVFVLATVGGIRSNSAPTKAFFVPRDEYEDPNRSCSLGFLCATDTGYSPYQEVDPNL